MGGSGGWRWPELSKYVARRPASVECESAYAKINLALHVRRRREDGYHDLETLFAFCAHGDVIEAAKADDLTLTIDGPFAQGLSATDNLVLRAATLLGGGRGAAIRLTKNLPIASGIGGGSADAAATLRLLSRLWKVDFDLIEIASKLGSDVPACVASVTTRGQGRGTELVPELLDVGGTPILLIHPGTSLPTAPVFGGWDGKDRGTLTDWRQGRNDLTLPACQLVPAIGTIIDWLASRPGIVAGRMSGSGATCFGLFENIAAREDSAAAAARRFPGYWLLQSVLR